MKKILGWAAVIWLVLAAIVLVGGTAAGIHDNIQFKDWLSVRMWAVFGPVGFALSMSGAVRLGIRLSK
jgi:hypothetical protein